VIESIELRQFRNHKKTTLHLDPHVTVLVGPNGSGKSNLIRAVRWVAANKPSGDSMLRRKGTKQADLCEATLRVDGRTVTRAKGEGRNEYVIDGNKVAVPKTGVPKPVDELLSMGEANFAMHWRGPAFWFGLTPGQAAKELNRIVNLDKIDSVLANVSAKARRVKAEQSVSADRLKAAKIKKGQLVYVPKLVADWKALETLESELTELQENERVVNELLSEASRLKEEVDRSLGERQSGKTLMSLIEEAVKMTAEEGQIERLVQTVDELEQEIAESEAETVHLQADLDRRCEGSCPICQRPWSKS
jgi:chromosome segregation ATPase